MFLPELHIAFCIFNWIAFVLNQFSSWNSDNVILAIGKCYGRSTATCFDFVKDAVRREVLHDKESIFLLNI